MKKRLKKVQKKWLEALRSGEYKQTKSCLRNEYGFCCLGVLCDLYREENGGKWIDEGYQKSFLQQGSLPAKEVVDWVGLRQSNPRVSNGSREVSLSALNDNNSSFKEIADFIDNNREKVFK